MAKGKLGKAKFCPWCGNKTIRRDTFSGDTQAEHTHVSYICDTCCLGFSLKHSPRVMFAHRMFAIERAQRPPEERIGQQLKIDRGGCPPLTERSLEDLERIERLLLDKKPHTKSSREHIKQSLDAVRNEINRRHQA